MVLQVGSPDCVTKSLMTRWKNTPSYNPDSTWAIMLFVVMGAHCSNNSMMTVPSSRADVHPDWYETFNEMTALPV